MTGAKEKGSETAAPIEEIIKSANREVEYGAKVQTFPDTTKDIVKIYEFFKYKTATTLDAAKATGVLRNSITFYVSDLEKAGLLQAVYRRPDRQTGYLAKWYSADPTKWRTQPRNIQLDLFDNAFEKAAQAPDTDPRSGERNILKSILNRKANGTQV